MFWTALRHALFSHIQGLSFSEQDAIGTSTLVTRMTSDINQIQSGVNLFLRLFMRSPFIVFGAMIMAFTINVKAALVFTVVIPLLCVVVFGIMLVSIPLYRRVQERLDRVTATTRENLQGVRVIRAFCKEEEEKKRFHRENEALVKIQTFSGRISALMNPVTYVIINGGIIALIYTGAIQVDLGIITQGEVVALVNYMSQILVELVKLANLIITVTKAIACGNRVGAILETDPGMKDGTAAHPEFVGEREPAVAFCHASLKYKNGGDEALTDLDFTVQKGETIGIIGGTGSGKSSLVNLIPRFYDVTEGSVKVNGTDVRDYRIQDLRGKIGIVMQKAVLFKGTIRENLMWGNETASEEELMEAVRAAQAEDVVAGKREGLDAFVEQEGRNFSGGQKQRLTIARALVRRPEILILDDSASALDFATDARLREAIRNLPGQMTVFIVSQRASTIQYADKIVVLDDGCIAGIGKHEELLKSCEVYRETYYAQFPREEMA